MGRVLARGRNRFRRADHHLLRPVREETPRDAGTGRTVEAMAGLIARLSLTTIVCVKSQFLLQIAIIFNGGKFHVKRLFQPRGRSQQYREYCRGGGGMRKDWKGVVGKYRAWAPFRRRLLRLLRQIKGVIPFPHLWNYREPIRILDTFFCGAGQETGSGKHNRYLDVPGMSHILVTREPAFIRAVLSATSDKPGHFDRDTAPTAGIARATGEDSLLYANGPLWRRQKKLAAPPFNHSSLFQPEKFHEFERTFRKTVAERLEALRARQEAIGERVTRLALEPEISVVMLEMLVNNFFGGSVSYERLRDRFVPALSGLIDYMVRDTIGRALRAPFMLLSGANAWLTAARADFETLTDIA